MGTDKDKFAKDLNDVLRFGSTPDRVHVEDALGRLGSPEHLLTRAGHPKGDSFFRGQVADLLEDAGRTDEAHLIRQGGHVVVHDGKVKPGRFTIRPLYDAVYNATHRIQNAYTGNGNIFDTVPGRHVPLRFVNRIPIYRGDSGDLIEHGVEGHDHPVVRVHYGGQVEAGVHPYDDPRSELRHRWMPIHELSERFADSWSQLLTEMGVDRRNPLWRHVSRMRAAPFEEVLPESGTKEG